MSTDNYISLITRDHRVADFIFFDSRLIWSVKGAIEAAQQAVADAKEDGTKLRLLVWSKQKWPTLFAEAGILEVGELSRKNFNAALEDEDEV